MSYKRVDASLLDVPGKMDPDEMAFLAALAARVPSGGRIVEIGPFYGRSTNAMAGANPAARITSIDTFENVEWTARYASRYSEIPAFGRAAFDTYTGHLDNVTAIEGFSPDVVADWDQPIDMYFEDAIHGNPGLKRNLDFWIGHLKPGGIACGHDYTRRFPDIKREVDAWAERWGTRVAVVGSLWALRKPVPGEPVARTARGLAPALTDLPRLMVRSGHRGNRFAKAQGGYWCGTHLEAHPMLWLSIDDIAEETGWKLSYRLGHPEFGETEWFPAGRRARLISDDAPQPFTRLAVRLDGPANSDRPKVVYRVSVRQLGNGGNVLSGTSDWAAEGDWAMFHREGAPVTSVTVSLLHDLPAAAQGAFSRTPSAVFDTFKRAVGRRILRLGIRNRVRGSTTG